MSLDDAKRAVREMARQGATPIEAVKALLEHYEERHVLLSLTYLLQTGVDRFDKSIAGGKVVIADQGGEVDMHLTSVFARDVKPDALVVRHRLMLVYQYMEVPIWAT